MKTIGRTLLLVVIMQFSGAVSVLGQVSLSPEVGVSYLPYKYGGGGFDWYSSKTVNVLIGISGTVPVEEHWYIYTRISYTPRKNFSWREYGGIATEYYEFFYKHSDINIDFSLTRILFDKFYFGLGPSVVRKINSSLTTSFHSFLSPDVRVRSKNLDAFHYGFSTTAAIDIKWGVLKLEYFQGFKSCCEFPFFTNKRINFVYSYPIQVGKRR